MEQGLEDSLPKLRKEAYEIAQVIPENTELMKEEGLFVSLADLFYLHYQEPVQHKIMTDVAREASPVVMLLFDEIREEEQKSGTNLHYIRSSTLEHAVVGTRAGLNIRSKLKYILRNKSS